MVWLKWPPGSCLLGVLEFMLHFNSVIFLLSNALMLVGVFFLLFFFSFLFFSFFALPVGSKNIVEFISLLNNLPQIQCWSAVKFPSPKIMKTVNLQFRSSAEATLMPYHYNIKYLNKTTTKFLFYLFIFLKISELSVISCLPHSRLRSSVGHLPPPSICKIYMDESSAASRLACTVGIHSGKRLLPLGPAAGQCTYTFSNEVLTFSVR